MLGGDKPAICITEPEAGSAASEMTTRAERKGDRYVVNGVKHWITGGGVSRLHLVFARVFDEAGKELGIGGFLAIRDQTKGLVIGAREPTMGLRGIPEAQILFQDMEIADDMVVLPPSGFRRGFADLMNAYNSQRVGAATVALGLADGAYQLALDYAKSREQFGRPIAEFQGLQWMLADMSVQIAAARELIWQGGAIGRPRFPMRCLPRRRRSSPRKRRSRSPTTRCRCSAPPATRATGRWSAWCATRGCSPSAAARRRSCGPWWQAASSTASCRRPATAISATTAGGRWSEAHSPSASHTTFAVSAPEKFCCPVTRLPSRMAKPFHKPAWKIVGAKRLQRILDLPGRDMLVARQQI